MQCHYGKDSSVWGGIFTLKNQYKNDLLCLYSIIYQITVISEVQLSYASAVECQMFDEYAKRKEVCAQQKSESSEYKLK